MKPCKFFSKSFFRKWLKFLARGLFLRKIDNLNFVSNRFSTKMTQYSYIFFKIHLSVGPNGFQWVVDGPKRIFSVNFKSGYQLCIMDALVSSYPNLGSKLPENDATITRKKDDATVNFSCCIEMSVFSTIGRCNFFKIVNREFNSN